MKTIFFTQTQLQDIDTNDQLLSLLRTHFKFNNDGTPRYPLLVNRTPSGGIEVLQCEYSFLFYRDGSMVIDNNNPHFFGDCDDCGDDLPDMLGVGGEADSVNPEADSVNGEADDVNPEMDGVNPEADAGVSE